MLMVMLASLVMLLAGVAVGIVLGSPAASGNCRMPVTVTPMPLPSAP